MAWHAWHHLEATHHNQGSGVAADESADLASGPSLGNRPGGEEHPHLVFPSLVRPEFKAGTTHSALPPRSPEWALAQNVFHAPPRSGVTARGSPSPSRTALPRAPPAR